MIEVSIENKKIAVTTKTALFWHPCWWRN